jgi:hypothetical protein
MPSTVLYMSMSLDGFVAGPNEGPDNGLGDGGVYPLYIAPETGHRGHQRTRCAAAACRAMLAIGHGHRTWLTDEHAIQRPLADLL